MRSFALILLVLAAFCTSTFAQTPPDYAKLQQQGVDAVNAGRFDEGIAKFKQCLELVPEDATSAYNIGCCNSRKNDKDAAFEWLDKSASWGFGDQNSRSAQGATISNVEFSKSDSDLTALHEDPRWAKFIERMTAARKTLEDFSASPAIYIPKALEGAQELPLLVVLHAEFKTKNTVVEGRWKNLADTLGCALLAPSGKFIPKGIDPTAGMQWIDSTTDYAMSPRAYEKPVTEALAAFQKDHKLAADRLFLAGEGIGGMLAFNIAVTKAGTYKGVLLVDAPIHEKLASSRVSAAAKAGLRVHLIESKLATAKYFGAENIQDWLDTIGKKLSDWGFAAKVEMYELEPGASGPAEAMILAALEGLRAPAAIGAAPAK